MHKKHAQKVPENLNSGWYLLLVFLRPSKDHTDTQLLKNAFIYSTINSSSRTIFLQIGTHQINDPILVPLADVLFNLQ